MSIISIKQMSTACIFALALAGPALAQNSSPVCNQTQADLAHAAPSDAANSTNSMADTSSGTAKTATGASSAAIGTGPTDKIGVNSPCVPGMGSHGSTGALPDSTPNTP
jgi:hypothetical protein